MEGYQEKVEALAADVLAAIDGSRLDGFVSVDPKTSRPRWAVIEGEFDLEAVAAFLIQRGWSRK